MDAPESPTPWWKSDTFFNRIYTAALPALMVALLVYSIAKTDQQLAAMNARIDLILIELADTKAEPAKTNAELAILGGRVTIIEETLTDIDGRLTNLEETTEDIEERLSRLEVNQREIISDMEAHEQEHALLSP